MENIQPQSSFRKDDIFSIPFNSLTYSRFFIWVPIFGVALCLIQYLSSAQPPDMHMSVVRFIKNIILLDAIHLAFTFGIMFGSTPGRDLLVKKKHLLARKRNLLLLIFTVLFISLGNFINFRNPNVPFIGGSFVFMFFWIWALAPTFHTMRQSYGIGLLIKKTGIWEKRILHTSFIFVLIALILSQFKGDGSKLATIFFSILAFISVFCFFILLYKTDNKVNSTKFLFSIRFLLWPLMFFSPIATFFIVFLHGQEYLYTYSKILKFDKHKEAKKKSLIISGILLLAIVPLCTIGLVMGLDGKDPWTGPLSLAILFSILPLINLLHYIADSFLYRMKDHDVALTIGKALN